MFASCVARTVPHAGPARCLPIAWVDSGTAGGGSRALGNLVELTFVNTLGFGISHAMSLRLMDAKGEGDGGRCVTSPQRFSRL